MVSRVLSDVFVQICPPNSNNLSWVTLLWISCLRRPIAEHFNKWDVDRAGADTVEERISLHYPPMFSLQENSSIHSSPLLSLFPKSNFSYKIDSQWKKIVLKFLSKNIMNSLRRRGFKHRFPQCRFLSVWLGHVYHRQQTRNDRRGSAREKPGPTRQMTNCRCP